MNKQRLYPFVSDEQTQMNATQQRRVKNGLLGYLMARHAGKSVTEAAASTMCKGVQYVLCAKFILFKDHAVLFDGTATCANATYQNCHEFHHPNMTKQREWDAKKVVLARKTWEKWKKGLNTV